LAWRPAEGLRDGREIVIVHGACPTGADAIADRIARFHGHTVEDHPAERGGRRWPSAGPLRNAEMAAAGADVCLGFVMPCSRPWCAESQPHDSHGASGCLELALGAGITSRVFRPGPAIST
jgi:SLOG family YspA-like protein